MKYRKILLGPRSLKRLGFEFCDPTGKNWFEDESLGVTADPVVSQAAVDIGEIEICRLAPVCSSRKPPFGRQVLVPRTSTHGREPVKQALSIPGKFVQKLKCLIFQNQSCKTVQKLDCSFSLWLLWIYCKSQKNLFCKFQPNFEHIGRHP